MESCQVADLDAINKDNEALKTEVENFSTSFSSRQIFFV